MADADEEDDETDELLGEGIFRRSRPWARWLGIVAAVAAPLVFIAGVAVRAPANVALPLTFIALGAAAFGAVAHFSARRCVMHAGPDGLRTPDEERLLEKSSFDNAHVVPLRGGKGSRARFLDRKHRWVADATFEEADAADRLLDAMALTQAQRVIEHFGLPPVSRFPLVIMTTILTAFCAASVAVQAMGASFGLSLLLIALGLAVSIASVWRSRIQIAADGIAAHWLGSKRFYPFCDIDRVEEREGSVVLIRHDGTTAWLHPYSSKDVPQPNVRLGTLHGARRALERYRAERSARAADQLARGERSLEQWKADLEKLGRGHSDYRSAEVTETTLWDVVESASAAPSARAGAARVLREILDPAGRARLRDAAQASAAPRVRVALELCADEEVEIDVLDAALARAVRKGD